MKKVESLRDIYKVKGKREKTLWIVGCGPSLDDYPDNFFDPPTKNKPGRISLAVGFSFIRFPKCQHYIAVHDSEAKLVSKVGPESLKKFVLILAPLQTAKDLNLATYEEFGDAPTYARWSGRVEGSKEEFQRVVADIMAGKSCPLVQRGTTAHFAIEIAALMGAKKIVLAGCEAKTTKEHWYAKRGGMKNWCAEGRRHNAEYPPAYRQGKVKDFLWYRNGVILLANELRKYKIKVVRFNPRTGREEEIPTEEEKFKLQIGGSEYPFFLYHKGYLLMDYPRTRGVDIVHDFRKPFSFANDSIEEVVAFHSLCRLSEEEIVPTLWECYRVLVPDGRLVVTVPEFARICRDYLEKGTLTSDLIGKLYGDSYEWRLQYKYCFSLQSLFKVLRAAGFGRFKMMNPERFKKEFFGESKEQNESILQEGDMIVEAIKGKKEIEKVEKKEVD